MKSLWLRLRPENLGKLLQHFLSFALCCLAVILLVFLVRETWSLVCILWYGARQKESYLLIEAIIIWFLYFEFIALISKYFKSHYHFPLRYFIYIGITAIIRLIIVDHDRPMDTLIYSFAILVLMLALYIANTRLLKRI